LRLKKERKMVIPGEAIHAGDEEKYVKQEKRAATRIAEKDSDYANI
jgi:hypothetical protein